MLGVWESHSTLPLLEKIAAFGEKRQQVLAGNLANIDTPSYRTRDLPVKKFQEALRAQIAGRNQVNPTSPSERGDTAAPVMTQPISQKLYEAVEVSSGSQSFQDGSNRSIERELTEMTKNSMLQQFSIELMTAQTNLLQAVISERP
ncbi:flagellar basal body rod protein FlgB [Thalassoroseus pseudoceratinae]|uniref:flagellar basal body rod protein FlgB n=1 Tax=Thalassoroseus pseudoceratinae TaxID=2713176 RepID=UPI001420C254|nr:flagellar basal body rod protein FlgB [Thalassoroseus pseudoceratinae]